MGQIEFTKNHLGDDFDTRCLSDLWRLERFQSYKGLTLAMLLI
jgi:hypothetical protein